MFCDLVKLDHGVVWNYYIHGQKLNQILYEYYLPTGKMKKRHLGTQPHIFGIELSIEESLLLFTS